MPLITSSFTLIKAILLSIISLGIIGSVGQLVAALFALAAAQDVNDIRDQSLMGKSLHLFTLFNNEIF
jgi:hypothetical protein